MAPEYVPPPPWPGQQVNIIFVHGKDLASSMTVHVQRNLTFINPLSAALYMADHTPCAEIFGFFFLVFFF